MREGYTPAQHNSRRTDALALWQAECDSLAASGAAAARLHTVPFPDVLHDFAVVFHAGRMVVSLSHTAKSLYTAHRPTSSSSTAAGADDDAALLAWQRVVESNDVPSGGLRFAYWIRGAAHTHTSATADFHPARRAPPSPADIIPPLVIISPPLGNPGDPVRPTALLACLIC